MFVRLFLLKIKLTNAGRNHRAKLLHKGLLVLGLIIISNLHLGCGCIQTSLPDMKFLGADPARGEISAEDSLFGLAQSQRLSILGVASRPSLPQTSFILPPVIQRLHTIILSNNLYYIV